MIRAMINGISFFHINTRQAYAIIERIPINSRHAIRYLDALQAAASTERTIADARHAVRDLYTLQALAIIERLIADACYASVRGNDAVFAPQNQSFFLGFDQTSICAMINRIFFFHIDTL